MFRFGVLSSGSCGNCYVLYDGEDCILLDLGISEKKVEEGLEELEINPEKVLAIFITHLHPDHAGKGLPVFLKRYPVPVYINGYAAKKEHKDFVKLGLNGKQVRFFTSGDEIQAGNFLVKSTDAFHDSRGCVSYFVTNGENKICLITDTGYFSDEMVSMGDRSNLLFLESNYDDEILETSSYAHWLKERIRSEEGHLSNEQAKRLLLKLSKNKERKVFLIHISADTNTAERAEEVSSAAAELNGEIKALSKGEKFLGGF